MLPKIKQETAQIIVWIRLQPLVEFSQKKVFSTSPKVFSLQLKILDAKHQEGFVSLLDQLKISTVTSNQIEPVSQKNSQKNSRNQKEITQQLDFNANG